MYLEFSLSSLADMLYGRDLETKYKRRYLDKSLLNLMHSTVHIGNVDRGGVVAWAWITSYVIPGAKSNAGVRVNFNRELMPHLLDLRRNYLSYDVKNILDLKNSYSIRIF